ncbi:MAG: hypothetical protein ACXWP6_11080 [Ktedonobacterales bacterium]
MDGTGVRLPAGAWTRQWDRTAFGGLWKAAWVQSAVLAGVVALALILSAWVYYARWGFDHRPWGDRQQASPVPIWLAFNDLGYLFAARVGDQADAVAPIGYDGQFYYYMAQNPGVLFTCARGPERCPIDASLLRAERILYPMTAHLLALGDPAALHVVLFAIDFVSIVVTAVVVGWLCVAAGASRWLGAAAAIYCGELQGLLHDLADPYAVLWTVLAVAFLRTRRPLLCGAAVAAATLSREQLVFVLPLLAIPWLAQRQWRAALLFLVVALGPFVAWQAALRAIFGHWGLEGSFATTHGVHLPFSGLWAQRSTLEFGDMVVFVAVPLVGAGLVALAWMRRHGIRALLADPVPLVVLVSVALATLTDAPEWEGLGGSARLVASGIALGMVVACDMAPWLRRSYAAVVGATALATFVLPPLLL